MRQMRLEPGWESSKPPDQPVELQLIDNTHTHTYIYTRYTLFICLQVEEELIESQRQVYEQKIMLNNTSTISLTIDEEMKHAHNSNNDINLGVE